MIRLASSCRLRGSAGVFLALCASTSVLAQGFPNFWDPPVPLQPDDYSISTNWDAGGVPQASVFEERAVIDNGGTAYLDVSGVPNPGGIDVLDGTLEIRRGGSLITEVGSVANGTVTVGVAGNLIVGELTGANPASLEAVAGATIQGTLGIIGPNANFSAASIGLSGTLHSTVTGGGYSSINTAGTATLSGPLLVTFDGINPTIGAAYDFVDAGTIVGGFSELATTSPLPAGLFLEFGTVPGGMHGTVGRVTVDSRLVLSVDRRSGQTYLQNLTTTETVSIDGYSITSQSGSLSPGSWQTFNANGFPDFRISNPADTHVGELNILGSRGIGPESNISLGALYDDSSVPLTQTVDGDLSFQYYVEGVGTKTGIVDYHGAHNNLVLVVNPDGRTYIQNQSTVDIELDGYSITSLSSSLNESGWNSFASSDSEWRESNPADNHLAELRLFGSTHLAAESGAIDLGQAFAVAGERDLIFTYHVAGMLEQLVGTVEYDEGVIEFTDSIPGDYDNNGTVELADYTKWRGLFGSDDPDADGNNDSVVNAADYVIWRNNLGAMQSGSGAHVSAVPEPAAISLLLVALGAVLLRIYSP